MPIFNKFHINEELLGRVMAAKKHDDLIPLSEADKALIKQLYKKSENDTKSLSHRLLEKIFNKQITFYKNNKGGKSIKVVKPNDEYIPTLKVCKTTERPMDFKNNIYRWLWYIKASRKRMELERMKSEEAEKKDLVLS